MPECIRGGHVALDDGGRLVGWCVGIFLAVFHGDGAVVEFPCGRLFERTVPKSDIQLKHFGPVLKNRVLARRFGTKSHIARAESRWYLS